MLENEPERVRADLKHQGARIMEHMKISIHIVLASLICLGCSGNNPATITVTGGSLAECPSSPNCVSSQSDNPKSKIDPIMYGSSKEEARARLIHIITSMDRTRIITETNDYLHIEFTSRIFRFVDDVEFQIDDSKKIIHFRSASRIGYSDLGANRKRMEQIRKKFLSY